MKKTMKTISETHRECLAKIAGMKEFPTFMEFLQRQKQNIAILEWSRVRPNDPEIREKKANFEGQFLAIDALIKAFELARKKEND